MLHYLVKQFVPAQEQQEDSHVMIGAGLPLIPAKLVSKIEAGEFVDIAELLPDGFGWIVNQLMYTI